MIKIIKKLSIAMLTASILFATIGTSAHAASKDNKKIQYYKEYQSIIKKVNTSKNKHLQLKDFSAMIKNSFFCFLSIKYLLSYFEMIQNGPPASAPLLASLYRILKSHALFLALLPQSATKIFPSPVIPLSTI